MVHVRFYLPKRLPLVICTSFGFEMLLGNAMTQSSVTAWKHQGAPAQVAQYNHQLVVSKVYATYWRYVTIFTALQSHTARLNLMQFPITNMCLFAHEAVRIASTKHFHVLHWGSNIPNGLSKRGVWDAYHVHSVKCSKLCVCVGVPCIYKENVLFLFL